MTDTFECIARGEVSADEARKRIIALFDETNDFSKIYAVLLRWTWVALAERRADDELRPWHRLLLDIAAKTEVMDGGKGSHKVGPLQTAERLRALSDLVKISVSMQNRPDKERLLTRAHVPELLNFLHGSPDKAAERREIQAKLRLKTANLSRILTLLVLEGLVERQPTGRTARFRITAEGERHLANNMDIVRRAVVTQGLPSDVPKIVRQGRTGAVSAGKGRKDKKSENFSDCVILYPHRTVAQSEGAAEPEFVPQTRIAPVSKIMRIGSGQGTDQKMAYREGRQ